MKTHGNEVAIRMAKIINWQNNLPGLRAIRLPKFGSEAGCMLLWLFGLIDLVHSQFLIYRIVIWIAFCCAALPFAAVYLYRIGQTIQCAVYRLRNLPPPNQWSGQNALMQFTEPKSQSLA